MRFNTAIETLYENEFVDFCHLFVCVFWSSQILDSVMRCYGNKDAYFSFFHSTAKIKMFF